MVQLGIQLELFPITLEFKLGGFLNDFRLSLEPVLFFFLELGCQVGFERTLDRLKVDLIDPAVMTSFPQLRAPERLKLLHPIEPTYYPFFRLQTSM